jgi:hypothetical protein
MRLRFMLMLGLSQTRSFRQLEQALQQYSISIREHNGYIDAKAVSKQQTHFGLNRDAFVSRFTEKGK